MEILLGFYMLCAIAYIPIYLYKNRITYFIEGMSWPPLRLIAGFYISSFRAIIWPYFLINHIVKENKLKKELELSNNINDAFDLSKNESEKKIKKREDEERALEEIFKKANPQFKKLENEIQKLDKVNVINDSKGMREGLDENATNFIYSKNYLMIKFHTLDKYGHHSDITIQPLKNYVNNTIRWHVFNNLKTIPNEGKEPKDFKTIEKAIQFAGRIIGAKIGSYRAGDPN